MSWGGASCAAGDEDRLMHKTVASVARRAVPFAVIAFSQSEIPSHTSRHPGGLRSRIGSRAYWFADPASQCVRHTSRSRDSLEHRPCHRRPHLPVATFAHPPVCELPRKLVATGSPSLNRTTHTRA